MSVQNSPDRADRLRVSEIFHSIQGESAQVGWPTVFVRLTGCPLRCHYCDTAYAFTGGEWMSFRDIIEKVASYGCGHVLVTGGEPLAQRNCYHFLEKLCDAGFRVSLETSGAMDLGAVDRRVVKVMDIKTPASGESDRNRLQNLQYLGARDQIKFVIADEEDYHWSCRLLKSEKLADCCEVLFSPVYRKLAEKQLANWILRDRLPVRFQFQLHKYLWGDRPGV